MTVIIRGSWTLHYTIGTIVTGPVSEGDEVTDFRGDTCVVRGGIPPHKEGSTGRVSLSGTETTEGQLYFPSVVGLKWVQAS